MFHFSSSLFIFYLNCSLFLFYFLSSFDLSLPTHQNIRDKSLSLLMRGHLWPPGPPALLLVFRFYFADLYWQTYKCSTCALCKQHWADSVHIPNISCVCVCVCRNGSRVWDQGFITLRPTTSVQWPAWRNSEFIVFLNKIKSIGGFLNFFFPAKKKRSCVW